MVKKKVFILSFLLFWASASGQESIKLGEYRFFNPKDTLCFPALPWMWVLIETTCYLNCEILTNIETIIRVTEKCMENDPEYFSGYGAREEIKNITLPNLKTHHDKMSVVVDDYYSGIHMKGCGINDYTITDIFATLPYNSRFMIGEPPIEYYKFREKFTSGRYFDKDNLPIVGDEFITISEEFISEKEKLEKTLMQNHPHSYYTYETKEIPIYQFLEYRKGGQLYRFCEKQILKSSLPYYQRLEEILENICEKYNLSRIIFMVLDYID